MTYLKLCCVLIFFAPAVIVAAESENAKECTKTISLCKISNDDAENIPIAITVKGVKGEWGPKGLTGDPGISGINGLVGEPGKRGDLGAPGDSPQGDKGIKGETGTTGQRGVEGPPGTEGNKGPDGIKGTKGNIGLIGPPGEPGSNGTCPCPINEPSEMYSDTLNEVVCKDISVKYDPDETYYIDQGMHDDELILVKCIPQKDAGPLTCIDPNQADTNVIITYNITNVSNGFWLSHNGTTLKDIYGLNRTQIEWFHKRSTTAIQTIRYHCFNSVPYVRHNVEKSLLLLTWNDNTIGPMPTLTNPYFYSVENDNCYVTRDEWTYTDITIVSNSHRRIPIIDFYFQDIGNPITQRFKIEFTKLCFG